MNYTTNFNLNKPEGTDLYNHLTIDNPNMDTIDMQMQANKLASVGDATELVSGTLHAITRADSEQNIFRFKATGNFKAGDTVTVDGVSVNAYTTAGQQLADDAYVLSAEVLCILDDTSLWVLTNKSQVASDVDFDNTGTGLISTNVEDAIKEVNQIVEDHDTLITAGTLSGLGDYLDLPADAKNIYIVANINGFYFSEINKIRYSYNILEFGYGTWLANFEILYSAGRITWNSETTVAGSKAATWTTSVRVLYTK